MEHQCEQYGDEWARLRLGIPTASGFHNIITPTGIPTRGITRRKYLYRLVVERLLKQVMDDNYESKWMKRGSDLEADAVRAFLDHSRKHPSIKGVQKAGFFTALNKRAGASPDGILMSARGQMMKDLLEIKCAAPYTHVGYLLDGPGTDYKAQVQGQLWVTGAGRVHFWAWHPNMPPFYTVTPRDDEYIGKLHEAVLTFCDEVDEAEAFCRGLGSYRLAEKLRLSDEMVSVGDILANLNE